VGWTRWPTEVPSNPYYSVILWFCGSVTSVQLGLFKTLAGWLPVLQIVKENEILAPQAGRRPSSSSPLPLVAVTVLHAPLPATLRTDSRGSAWVWLVGWGSPGMRVSRDAAVPPSADSRKVSATSLPTRSEQTQGSRTSDLDASSY